MKKHLEKLRSRSDDEKKKLAQTMAIIATIGVILIWILVLSLTPKNSDQIQNENQAEETNGFLEIFSTGFSTISDQFNQEKENFNEVLIEAEEQQQNQESFDNSENTNTEPETTDNNSDLDSEMQNNSQEPLSEPTESN